MGRLRMRTTIVSLVAAGSVFAGAAVAAPAVADQSQPASTSTTGVSSPVTGTLELLLLEVDRLLLPGCLEATLSILLRQGGTPGPCLN